MSVTARAERTFQVLLVDDSAAEVLFLKDCLKSCTFPIGVRHVDSGEECLAFLRKEGRYGDAVTPDLIISDFNLPGMNGTELVGKIATDPALGYLPVLVMSSWDRQEDIDRLYGLGCNSFIAKPTSLDELESVVQAVCHYWFSVVALPS
jgi:chemotaxis family two-component system response regulator Rcp1